MTIVHMLVAVKTDMMPGAMHTVESVVETTQAVLKENLHTYVQSVELVKPLLNDDELEDLYNASGYWKDILSGRDAINMERTMDPIEEKLKSYLDTPTADRWNAIMKKVD